MARRRTPILNDLDLGTALKGLTESERRNRLFTLHVEPVGGGDRRSLDVNGSDVWAFGEGGYACPYDHAYELYLRPDLDEDVTAYYTAR